MIDINNRQGFTLIEILLTLTLLSIILLSFLSFFVQSGNYGSRNSEKITAVNLAHQYLELELLHFEEIEEQQSAESVLTNPCSPPAKSPGTFLTCYHNHDTVNGETFEVWTFIQEDVELKGFYPVITRVYYHDRYTETFGYYHPTEAQGSGEM